MESRWTAAGIKRRSGRATEATFPYAKSTLISFALMVVTMLATAALSDPKSGIIERSTLAFLLIAALPIAIAMVFFVEFRQKHRTKRPKTTL